MSQYGSLAPLALVLQKGVTFRWENNWKRKIIAEKVFKLEMFRCQDWKYFSATIDIKMDITRYFLHFVDRPGNKARSYHD